MYVFDNCHICQLLITIFSRVQLVPCTQSTTLSTQAMQQLILRSGNLVEAGDHTSNPCLDPSCQP
eukprot:m.88568 g.88568  ORF g.88568 m.88568 type:complete len:65 (-) comp14832_c0_seq11:2877-3071(-)